MKFITKLTIFYAIALFLTVAGPLQFFAVHLHYVDTHSGDNRQYVLLSMIWALSWIGAINYVLLIKDNIRRDREGKQYLNELSNRVNSIRTNTEQYI